MIVVPSASAAAIMMFSVPVTVHHVHHHARALQALRARTDVAVLDLDLRAERLEPLDVLVDRPRADRAAARQRDVGLPKRATSGRARGSTRASSSRGRTGAK
jgi:hypothetical protein